MLLVAICIYALKTLSVVFPMPKINNDILKFDVYAIIKCKKKITELRSIQKPNLQDNVNMFPFKSVGNKSRLQPKNS